MELSPSRLAILDLSPYNHVSLSCDVSQPQEVRKVKNVAWKATSPSGTVQTLSHNGATTNISSTGIVNASSFSELSLYATVAGRWRYTCSASIEVPGDPIIPFEKSSEVIVKGWQNNDIVHFSMIYYYCDCIIMVANLTKEVVVIWLLDMFHCATYIIHPHNYRPL